MKKVEFTVPGVPVGKARPKVTIHGTYTPKKTKDYEDLVRRCWKEQSGVRLREGVPLKMTVICYFPVPKSTSKKKRKLLLGKPHIKKPDGDNLFKSAADSIQDRTKKNRKTGEKTVDKGAFKDDSCISIIRAIKIYSAVPRMHVVVEEIEDKECEK